VHFSGTQVEVDAVERTHAGVALAESFDTEEGLLAHRITSELLCSRGHPVIERSNTMS